MIIKNRLEDVDLPFNGMEVFILSDLSKYTYNVDHWDKEENTHQRLNIEEIVPAF